MATAKKTAKKKPQPKKKIEYVQVPVQYIKDVYNDVCDEWRHKLEAEFPSILGKDTGISDRYDDGNNMYVLVQVGPKQVALIDEDYHTLKGVVITVKDIEYVTIEEFQKIRDSIKETLTRRD